MKEKTGRSVDADGQCIRSLGTLPRAQRFFLEKCGLKTCLTLSGEDGADIVSEGGRKYSMEARTNILLHAIEMRNQQRCSHYMAKAMENYLDNSIVNR